MKPPCPVCVAEVDEARIWRFPEVGFEVITLKPCGHELRDQAMEKYRERFVASQQS